MPEEIPDHHRLAMALSDRAGSGADGGHPAHIVVSTCRDIELVLAPIVGSRGVAALYQRSLHLAAASHPWLASAHDAALTTMDLAPLQSALAAQSRADAAAGGSALLQTFHDLLASLVGATLTERLLRPVWAGLLSGSAAQDTSP